MDKKELKAQAKAQKAQLKAEAKARKAEAKKQKREQAKKEFRELREETKQEFRKAREEAKQDFKDMREGWKQYRLDNRHSMSFDVYTLNAPSATLSKPLPNKKWDVTGSTTQFLEGHVGSRSTATRVAGGALLGGGAGAVVGSVAKKTTGNHLIMIDFADGDFLEIKVKPEDLVQAQKFVMCMNAVSERGPIEES